jgi:hypothetical protein
MSKQEDKEELEDGGVGLHLSLMVIGFIAGFIFCYFFGPYTFADNSNTETKKSTETIPEIIIPKEEKDQIKCDQIARVLIDLDGNPYAIVCKQSKDSKQSVKSGR